MAESKSPWFSPSPPKRPRLPRWWQFGTPVPANPRNPIDEIPRQFVPEPPEGWPGTDGEWNIYRQFATPRLPISYDRGPRPKLNGLRATFLIGYRLINVANAPYGPIDRAALQGQGYKVTELTEKEARRWRRAATK